MFVTFRLHGSLPMNRRFPTARLTSGQAFAAMDRLLDRARTGPFFLGQPEIASMFIRALFDGQHRFERYEVHAFVVMPNHVHLLVTPHVPARIWLGSLKGFTGHQAIKILGLERAPFWQCESHDHLVRNDEECARIRHYIEWNPVKAGLVNSPDEFPWSSAPGGSPAAGPKA